MTFCVQAYNKNASCEVNQVEFSIGSDPVLGRFLEFCLCTPLFEAYRCFSCPAACLEWIHLALRNGERREEAIPVPVMVNLPQLLFTGALPVTARTPMTKEKVKPMIGRFTSKIGSAYNRIDRPICRHFWF